MDSTSIMFRSHTALLLAAALPYLQPAYRHPVELVLKFLEFSETMKLYREFSSPDVETSCPLPNNSANSQKNSGIFELISRFVQDPEGLLCSLSNVCTGKESEFVGMLLNLIRAKSFYETYGDLLQGFMSSATPESPSTPEEHPQGTEDFSMPDMDSLLSGGNLTSGLSKEQTETLDLLKHLLDAD